MCTFCPPHCNDCDDWQDKEFRIRQRIERAFAEDATKYESDKHMALEDIERILDE